MRIASLFVLLVGLAGCSLSGDDPGPPPPLDPEAFVTDTTRAGLEHYRARWDEAGVAAYRFRFTRSCFCTSEALGPFEVVVRGGEVASVEFLGTGDRTEAERFGRLTVAELFEIVGDAFGNNAAYVSVSYEPALGLPAIVTIDYVAGVVDDELRLTLMAFERLDR